MKKLVKFSFLLVLFSLCFAIADVDAQNYGRKKKKKSKSKSKTEKVDEYFDESGNFASKLWYGGGFNLGFNGGNNFNSFVFGLTPMVGYKIVGDWSAGPVVGFQYHHLKGTGARDFQTHKKSTISWSYGAFTRYKFLRNFFVHAEYGIDNNEYFLLAPNGLLDQHPVTFELNTVRQSFNNFYGGFGYNAGDGALGYEIYIVYNFIDRLDDINYNPFNIRFGLTYKF